MKLLLKWGVRILELVLLYLEVDKLLFQAFTCSHFSFDCYAYQFMLTLIN
jgi:hypothetical protein